MSRPPPADLTVTLGCDNRCVFCARPTLRHVRVRDDHDLDSRLRAIRRRGRRVVLTGGEVTTLDDPVALVARCRAMGFDEIGLITNGRRLARRGLAKALLSAGLTEACVTLYDLRAAVHDGLTGAPGSLAESLAGLDALRALAAGQPGRFTVRVNTVLCADNADGLVALAGALARTGIRGLLVADAVLSDAFDRPCPPERIRTLAGDLASDPALRALDITWRGFPVCLLEGVDGVRAEDQRIDTTAGPEDALDRYFAEFERNFEYAPACAACAARARCRGVQRRTLDRFGDGWLRPRREEDDGVRVRPVDELASFEPDVDPGRLAVTPTDACSMRCGYCRVVLGRRRASAAVLDRSVDLLLTSRRDSLELQFFGGEPLLSGDEVLRTMERGADRARAAGKRLWFTLTTNGLLLDERWLDALRAFDVRVLFSIDGDLATMARQRPLARTATRADAPHRTIEHNLAGLVRSGIPYFANLVVPPEAAGELPARVAYLAGLGVEHLQVCYATGPGWRAPARAAFCAGLARIVEHAAARTAAGAPLRIQNVGSRAEPTILSTDLLVDVDGTLYGDAALFAERALPGLRDAYRVGHVDELERFDGLRRTRAHNLALLRATYPAGSPVRATVDEQLALGAEVQATLDRLAGARTSDGIDRARARAPRRRPRPGRQAVRDRNPLLRTVLRATLPEQAALMRRRPELLKLPLLMLANPCTWDCIFCRSKSLDPTPFEAVEGWLRANRELGLRRLGLVGNEPLAHPQLDRIIETARGAGFERLDVLTTAAPLADRGRVDALVAAGVRGYGLPLFGADAPVHDAVTRVDGSFAATLRALEHLRDAGAEVHVHTNLLRQNIHQARAMEQMIVADRGLPFCLIPVRPKDAHLPFTALMPRYEQVAALRGIRGLVAFPLCVSARAQSPALADGRSISDLLKLYVLDQPFVKPPRCAGCADRGRCAGTFQAYLDRWGDAELTPR